MSANMEMMEHRWGTRSQLNAPGELKAANGTTQQVIVSNASLSGAFIQTATRLPTLARVALHVHGNEHGNGWLEACVVRQGQNGLGLEWLNPATDSVDWLLASAAAPGNMP